MILHLLLGVAQASSYYIQPFSQFTHEAAAIVRGTLSNIHVENGTSAEGQKVIYTYASLEVKEVLKGSVKIPITSIREVGGTKDGMSIDIPGSPELKEGEDVVLFLGPENADQSHEVMGLELGKFAVKEVNGEPTLSGGLFNFVKPNDHNAGDVIPENSHPWSLAELRTTIEKQGGKDAPAQVTSTPATGAHSEVASIPAKLASEHSAVDFPSPPAPDLQDSRTSSDTTENNELPWLWIGCAIGLAILLFFRFRKR